MEPGRELDAVVAEKVIEHKVFHDHGQSFIASGQQAFDGMIADGFLFWEETKDESEYCLQLPHYSTNIAAAWIVVKEMISIGYSISIDYVGTWRCFMTRGGFGNLPVEAATAPLAVCLAALKAVGVEVEDD